LARHGDTLSNYGRSVTTAAFDAKRPGRNTGSIDLAVPSG